MSRLTKIVSISVPPEMEQRIQELMRLEGRTRSELFRDALRFYAESRRVSLLNEEIGARAREAGITSVEEMEELLRTRRHRKERSR